MEFGQLKPVLRLCPARRENVPILNDVSALYHQTVVLVRAPEEARISQMLGEVTMNMGSRIPYGRKTETAWNQSFQGE
jgi:hypothetical protein